MSAKPTYEKLAQRVRQLEKEVAALHHLKEDLRQTQDKHTTILDNIVEGYYEVDLKGNFIFFNRAMQDILGFETNELLGMNNREFMDKETSKKVFKSFNTVFETGKPSNTFNWTLIRKDGGKRHIETSITLIKDFHNTPTGFQGIARDVTDIRLAEHLLKKSEAKYRSLVENTPDLLYRTDMTGAIVFISPSVHRLSGYTVEEAVGMKMAQEVYAYPEERNHFLAQLQKNGKVRNFEARLRRKDGSIWWASTNAHFYKDSNGSILGVEGVTRDISDQKKIELALRESEEKFRLAFMTSPDAINLNRASDGLFIDINQGFTNLMGYARKDVVGKTSLELNIWEDAKDREFLVSGLSSKGVVENFEARFRRKDGTIRDGLMSARIIRIDDTDVILSVARDMTEQKQTQELLMQSEKMMSVGGLAAGMAHEINNPLAGIVQNSQVIANRLSPDLPANRRAAEKLGLSIDRIALYMEERQIYDMIGSLRKSGMRAAEIVSNILSFSRKTDASPSQLNLNRLIEKTIDIAGKDYDFKKKFDFKKITILREFPERKLNVTGFGSNIQQVLLNILRNSAEALLNTKDSNKPTIIVRLAREDGQARIEIEDNGPGIEKEVQKKIFEPFFTTKPVGQGTGLGLSISYFIINDIHKGEIFVTSEPGKGTTFVILLPI